MLILGACQSLNNVPEVAVIVTFNFHSFWMVKKSFFHSFVGHYLSFFAKLQVEFMNSHEL